MTSDYANDIFGLASTYKTLAESLPHLSGHEKIDAEDTMTKILGWIDTLIEKGMEE